MNHPPGNRQEDDNNIPPEVASEYGPAEFDPVDANHTVDHLNRQPKPNGINNAAAHHNIIGTYSLYRLMQ